MYAADFKRDHAVPWPSAMKVSALSEGFLVQSVCTGKYGRLVVRHGRRLRISRWIMRFLGLVL